MKIILVGEEESKRVSFMRRAAKEEGVELLLLPWQKVNVDTLEGAVVKLEPPSFLTEDLRVGLEQIHQYQKELLKLQKVNCRWVNEPKGLLLALDKYACKKKLQEAKVSVSQMFDTCPSCVEQLFALMEERKQNQVFIKPKIASGAAGVTAYRRTLDGRRQQLFTSSVFVDGALVNTKRMHRLSKAEEIREFLNALLSLDCVVEYWLPKAMVQGRSFDIRVVWQFGKIKFIIGRTAKGPITNLHLNNGAISWEGLEMTWEEWAAVEELCEKAMEELPGLSVAGLDVALNSRSRKPFLIEVNGQGDLIYQDIYDENAIYREQVKEMMRWSKL